MHFNLSNDQTKTRFTQLNFFSPKITKSLTLLLFCLTVSLLLSACGSITSVSSLIDGRHKYDYAQNFEGMKTYNFSSVKSSLSSNPDYIFIKSSGAQLAIENGMATKKLFKERHLLPDMWLNYYFTGDKVISVGQLNDLFDYNLGLAWDDKYGTGKGIANSSHTFSKQTIIIDLVYKKNNRLIWRGSASTGISAEDSERSKKQSLDKAVEVILDPFPPLNKFESLKTPVFDE